MKFDAEAPAAPDALIFGLPAEVSNGGARGNTMFILLAVPWKLTMTVYVLDALCEEPLLSPKKEGAPVRRPQVA
jgi:hypothetical protein